MTETSPASAIPPREDPARVLGFSRLERFVLHPFLLALHRLVAGLLFEFEIEGVENVPRKGPALIAANHLSLMDSPLLGMAIHAGSGRYVRYLAWEGFYGTFWGSYMRFYRTIPVRGTQVSALRETLALLRAGHLVGIFPEGGLSPDGRPQPYHNGVGWLGARTACPVVPVTILGTGDLWPPARRAPDPGPIRITFHAPIRPDPEECERRGGDGAFHAEITGRVRESILRGYPPSGRAEYPGCA